VHELGTPVGGKKKRSGAQRGNGPAVSNVAAEKSAKVVGRKGEKRLGRWEEIFRIEKWENTERSEVDNLQAVVVFEEDEKKSGGGGRSLIGGKS